MKSHPHFLLLFVGIVICLSSSCATQPAQKEKCLKALEDLPNGSYWAMSYRCKDMVKCVNTLRHAGKPQALAALTEYTQKHRFTIEPQTDRKLQWVCRLLFINPEGWPQLGIGATEAETNDSIARQYPFFPIAISDRVPFILSNGYPINGLSDQHGYSDVALCRSFSMVAADLPTVGYARAAKKLVQSELFQRLYKDPIEKEIMLEEILNQAE
jgi:hypothetical protein